MNFVIKYHFPNFLKEKENYQKSYLEVLKEIANRTAKIVAQWQAYGFCHGVMNTDNMSILGLTIDFGPFGFLDYYDSGHICNYSDRWGRYSFQRQPAMAEWNLLKLKDALRSVLGEDESNQLEKYIKEDFYKIFNRKYLEIMRNRVIFFLSKLGLIKDTDGANNLIKELEKVLNFCKSDFTNFFLEIEKFNKNSKIGKIYFY